MRLRTACGVIALLCCGIACAQTPLSDQALPCSRSLRIDQFLLPDDVIAAKAAFISLQSAIRKQDRPRVLESIHFPLDMVLSGRGTIFASPADLAKRYNEVFTGFVRRDVNNQNPERLIAGWNGVKTNQGAVEFKRDEDGAFRVWSIVTKYNPPTADLADFWEKRKDCPPVVIEGRVAAYSWVSHVFSGFEGIYIDHLVIDVDKVIQGEVREKRIRVDFWGVQHLPEYKLPESVFESGGLWRIYLRPDHSLPENPEGCSGAVQETIHDEDETGKVFREESAIRILNDENRVSFSGLSCFEARKQYFEKIPGPGSP